MKLKNQVPNILTLINLALGFLSIIFSFNHQFTLSAVLILVAVFFDFLDGQIARTFHMESKIGIELDSLADLVSFGIAPAVMMHAIFQSDVLMIILVFYVLASAFRLARFHVLKSKIEGFLGMPITVNGLLFPVLYFVGANLEIVAVIFVVSLVLMVSTLHFKKVI